MATDIINEIAAELQKLEQELKEFKTAVAYLKDAKDNVKSAVAAVNQAESYHLKNLNSIEQAYARLNMVIESVGSLTSKIDKVDFPARLASIEKSLDQVVKSIDASAKTTLAQLAKASEVITKANFDGKFKTLHNVVSSSIADTQKTIETTENNLIAKTDSIGHAVEGLVEKQNNGFRGQIEYYNRLNLSHRFERLDTTVTGLLKAVQNIQGRIDLTERNIKDKVVDVQERNTRLVEGLLQQLQATMVDNKRKSQRNFYITWVGIVLISIMAVAVRFLR